MTQARVANDRLDAMVPYEGGGRNWEQHFVAELLDELTLRGASSKRHWRSSGGSLRGAAGSARGVVSRLGNRFDGAAASALAGRPPGGGIYLPVPHEDGGGSWQTHTRM